MLFVSVQFAHSSHPFATYITVTWQNGHNDKFYYKPSPIAAHTTETSKVIWQTLRRFMREKKNSPLKPIGEHRRREARGFYQLNISFSAAFTLKMISNVARRSFRFSSEKRFFTKLKRNVLLVLLISFFIIFSSAFAISTGLSLNYDKFLL